MRILAASDFHGNLNPLFLTLEQVRPDLLLSPGDWGDPGEVTEAAWTHLLSVVTVVTVFGNHDDRALLGRLHNRDGSPVLLSPGEARSIGDLKIGGISGIWAKSKLGSKLNARWEAARKRNPDLTQGEFLKDRAPPPYVTDDEVAGLAVQLAGQGIDILITHGCPSGLADRTPSGMRRGQRCFRQACDSVRPAIHLCGHLHRFQRDDLPDGRMTLNCGDGSVGDGWLLTRGDGRWDVAPAQ